MRMVRVAAAVMGGMVLVATPAMAGTVAAPVTCAQALDMGKQDPAAFGAMLNEVSEDLEEKGLLPKVRPVTAQATLDVMAWFMMRAGQRCGQQPDAALTDVLAAAMAEGPGAVK